MIAIHANDLRTTALLYRLSSIDPEPSLERSHIGRFSSHKETKEKSIQVVAELKSITQELDHPQLLEQVLNDLKVSLELYPEETIYQTIRDDFRNAIHDNEITEQKSDALLAKAKQYYDAGYENALLVLAESFSEAGLHKLALSAYDLTPVDNMAVSQRTKLEKAHTLYVMEERSAELPEIFNLLLKAGNSEEAVRFRKHIFSRLCGSNGFDQPLVDIPNISTDPDTLLQLAEVIKRQAETIDTLKQSVDLKNPPST